MFHKSILKNETHPATQKAAAPTQEQMYSPFAALAPALPLTAILGRETSNPRPARYVPQPVLPMARHVALREVTGRS